jgi:acetyl esterase
MPLDPQAREFLDKLERSRAPKMHELSPQDARALVVPLRMPREAMRAISNRTIPGPAGEIPIRIYHPADSGNPNSGDATTERVALPVILYFHGGGWVVGSIASHDGLCRRLCNQSGCIVVSVDYRLAPERKYPAAVDDCFAATQWVFAHAAEFGGDPQRIVVAGDSAGGNLAAVVALIAREQGGPPIAAQLLIYPITDFMPEFDSYQRNGRDYFLTTETILWFWNHYLHAPEQGREWRASPIRASELTGLPPAIVLVAEFDPLYDEGLVYADRLAAAGVRVERIISPGQIHGFIRRLDLFASAADAVSQLSDRVRVFLGISST